MLMSIKGCIHGRIPQLAAIGLSESISNLYTLDMRCTWLSELLAGTFKVPRIIEMEKDVKKWDEYAKQYAGVLLAIVHWSPASMVQRPVVQGHGMEPQKKEGNVC